MKLVTFEVASPLGPLVRIGAVDEGAVVDLRTAYALALRAVDEPMALAEALIPSDMVAFLERGTAALDAARRGLALVQAARAMDQTPRGPRGETLVFPLDSVRLRAPLPRPASLRDFFAFEGHASAGAWRRGEELPQAWYEIPVYYKGNPRSIIGPDDDVLWPRYTRRLDYELELACVIGREGRNIPVAEAEAHIVGYAILNDFSARDIQRQEMAVRLGPAKAKDFATGLGPWLVTADEVGDPRALRMVARVNGEVWSEGVFGDIHWSFAQMIAHASQDETLYPGDILGSGTCTGGCGAELDRWLQPGDVVELEINRLGVLRNRVGPRG